MPRLLWRTLMVMKVDYRLQRVRVMWRVCTWGWFLPWHVGKVPLQVLLLVQVLVTALLPPVIMYPG